MNTIIFPTDQEIKEFSVKWADVFEPKEKLFISSYHMSGQLRMKDEIKRLNPDKTSNEVPKSHLTDEDIYKIANHFYGSDYPLDKNQFMNYLKLYKQGIEVKLT